MTLKEVIKKKLQESRENCEFKKAWIPKGFACVMIDKFALELADEIRIKLAK